MELLVVLLLLIFIGALAARFGVDSRDPQMRARALTDRSGE